MDSELEKMLRGALYDPSDPQLAQLRRQAHRLCKEYNDTLEEEEDRRSGILNALLPHLGEGTYLQGPIQFDYGRFTTLGCNCYANFHLTVLDCCPVTIGSNVLFGPNCSLVTPIHPLLAEERDLQLRPDGSAYALEYAAPIVIGDSCWLSSNVTVCGGVTIGSHCVIGAGSVVTRDIPDHSFAAGVPCRVIRPITEKDSIRFRTELF